MTNDELEKLALWHHALMVAEKMPKLEGLPKFYLRKLPKKHRMLIARFEAARRKTAGEMAALFEADGFKPEDSTCQ